ncbi:MAG: hypothetical protein WA705_25195 [Candidatus Ozemobacteraceae bacterium]
MESLRQIVVSLVICVLIGWLYSEATHRIRLQQGAESAEAVVIEREPVGREIFVKVEYRVKGQVFRRSFRTGDVNRFPLQGRVKFFFDPLRPGEPIFDLAPKQLADDVYYIMVFLLGYLIWRVILLMRNSTVSNWQ